MIAVLLDILGGWISARYMPNVLVTVLCAVAFGAVASITGEYLISIFGGDMFSERELIARAVAGVIWHSLVAVSAALYFRYRRRKIANASVRD